MSSQDSLGKEPLPSKWAQWVPPCAGIREGVLLVLHSGACGQSCKKCLLLSAAFPPGQAVFPSFQPHLPLQRDLHPQLPCRKPCGKPPSNGCHTTCPSHQTLPASPRVHGAVICGSPHEQRAAPQWAAIPAASPVPVGSAQMQPQSDVLLCVTVWLDALMSVSSQSTFALWKMANMDSRGHDASKP